MSLSAPQGRNPLIPPGGHPRNWWKERLKRIFWYLLAELGSVLLAGLFTVGLSRLEFPKIVCVVLELSVIFGVAFLFKGYLHGFGRNYWRHAFKGRVYWLVPTLLFLLIQIQPVRAEVTQFCDTTIDKGERIIRVLIEPVPPVPPVPTPIPTATPVPTATPEPVIEFCEDTSNQSPCNVYVSESGDLCDVAREFYGYDEYVYSTHCVQVCRANEKMLHDRFYYELSDQERDQMEDPCRLVLPEDVLLMPEIIEE